MAPLPLQVSGNAALALRLGASAVLAGKWIALAQHVVGCNHHVASRKTNSAPDGIGYRFPVIGRIKSVLTAKIPLLTISK